MLTINYGRCLLQDHLDRHRMSQARLSELSGVNRKLINDYIHHRKYMTLVTAVRISIVLNVTPLDLYEWTKWKSKTIWAFSPYLITSPPISRL